MVIELPEQKARALEMLMQDIPVREVAESLGVSRTAVYNWIKLPEFKEHLDKKEEIILDNLYNVTLLKLEEQLMSENVYAQQYAITQVLKLKGKNEVNVKVEDVSAPKTLEELLTRVKK